MTAIVRLLALCLAILLGTAPVHAHATLVGSQPADGSMLDSGPQRFVLSFNEPLSPLALTLVGGDGAGRALDGARADGNDLVIDDPGPLPNGNYALAWRAVSIDGHPISGTILFSVGVALAPLDGSADAQVDFGLRTAIVLTRLVIYLGLFFGVGGAFFAAFVAPVPSSARVAQISLLLLLPALALSVGLQGLDALGLPLGELTAGRVWSTGAGTSWGLAAVLAGGAAVAALLGIGGPPRVGPVAAVAALAGLGAAFASTGHASAASPQWLTRSAVFLHVVAVATWVGALIPLALLLVQDRNAARAGLQRFSRYIPWSVGALLAAGTILAVVQVGQPSALITTAYGRVLLVKLVLVALLLALALVNRFWLTKPAAVGETLAVTRLRRSIAAEVALVIAIFAVVPLWRFTPPPRSLEVAASAPAMMHLHGDSAMADVTLTPGRAGPVNIEVVVRTPDFGALPAKGVTLTFTQPEAGIEPIRRPADLRDGIWSVDKLTLPVAGRWQITVAVLVTDFDLVSLRGDVVLAP